MTKNKGYRPRKGIPSRFLPNEGTKNDQKRGNSKKHHPTVFDPSFFPTMLGGGLGNRASKKTDKKTCYPGDIAMRKTTSRLREPHTFSRPDFAKVHLIWEFFLNRTLSGPPVNTESTFSRPLLTTGNGLEKVYLLVFCLRKVRKTTKNAETAKNTIQAVCDPSYFPTYSGGPWATGPRKKLEKKNMLPGRYGHAKNDLPPPRTAYLF